MKKLNKIYFYLLSVLFVILTCIIGILRKPFPELLSDTATRIIQGILLIIAIICYLIQANRNTNKERSNNNGT